MNKETTKRNYLSFSQMFLLAGWVKENAAHLDGKRVADVTQLATETFGFNVSGANLRSARDASGASFRLAGEAHTEPLSDTQVLAREVIALFERLGDPVSEQLRRVAKG